MKNTRTMTKKNDDEEEEEEKKRFMLFQLLAVTVAVVIIIKAVRCRGELYSSHSRFKRYAHRHSYTAKLLWARISFRLSRIIRISLNLISPKSIMTSMTRE